MTGTCETCKFWRDTWNQNGTQYGHCRNGAALANIFNYDESAIATSPELVWLHLRTSQSFGCNFHELMTEDDARPKVFQVGPDEYNVQYDEVDPPCNT